MRSRVLFPLALSALFSASTFASTLTFSIHNVRSDQGKIYLQLFKGESAFAEGQALIANITPARQGTVTVSFHDLKAGEYALRYYHDENDNGKLDTNLFQIPTEGFGFSNDARPVMGPASYADMKVSLEGDLHDHSTINY